MLCSVSNEVPHTSDKSKTISSGDFRGREVHPFRFFSQPRLVLVTLVGVALSFTALAQFEEPEMSTLLAEMAGTWMVTQKTWTGPGVEATELPAAVAHRQLVNEAFLQEQMTLAPDTPGDPFNRTSYVNYNGVSGFYEYFSIDSRAPQQMNYQAPKRSIDARGIVELAGGVFIAAQWGEATNITFNYRAEITPVDKGRQTFKLFLTPMSGEGEEFQAFQYDYIKQ